MPVSITNGLQLPSFEIRAAGTPLKLSAGVQLIQVCVEEDVNLPSMLTLEFAGLDEQSSAISVIDDTQLEIGGAVQVKLGYRDSLVILMDGEITGIEPEFHFNRAPALTVRGYDRRHRLQRGRKSRTFIQQKDSDIATQIASEVGLNAKVQDSKVTHDYVMQANQSDWHFLQARAQQIGYEVIVEGKILQFREIANANSPKITLSFLDDLLEFYPRLSVMGQVTNLTVQGWDTKKKEMISGKAKSGDEVSTMGGQKIGATLSQSAFGSAPGVITDRPIQTQAEADQFAKAAFNQQVLNLITGEGISRGRTDLRAGIVIDISGIGKRFSGSYYVITARHTYSNSGYYTHFTVRRNAL